MRMIADASELPAEDLLAVFAYAAQLSEQDTEAMLAGQLDAELAGADWPATFGEYFGVDAFRRTLDTTDIEVLQRAAAAVFEAVSSQWGLLLWCRPAALGHHVEGLPDSYVQTTSF
ncbi:MAG: hypothetical protein JWR37_3629 [Mycobacterium sp.]|nr:hypothetical protein [Mycobacterium sp.]